MDLIRTAIDNEDLKSIQDSEEITLYQLGSCLAYAIHKKQFDIVDYIELKCPKFHNILGNCAFNAARDGYIDVVKYAESKGERRENLIDAAAYAAENGHFDILKYIVSKGYIDWTYYFTRAEKGGHEEIIKWCKIKGKDKITYHVLDWERHKDHKSRLTYG
uniref:Ankyrin repeat protein n=1 Tax=Pithovirus LCPAC403 TaxID=2506596 RepID=A0A481ZDG9_9VIRU|nr:MAG: ankyrin repeat protein [Pithovirus LCPAC403]